MGKAGRGARWRPRLLLACGEEQARRPSLCLAPGGRGRGLRVCGEGERPAAATRPRAAGVRSGPRGLGARVRPSAGDSGWKPAVKDTGPRGGPGRRREHFACKERRSHRGAQCLAGDDGPPSIEALKRRPLPTSALRLPSRHLLYFLLCLKIVSAEHHWGRVAKRCVPSSAP